MSQCENCGRPIEERGYYHTRTDCFRSLKAELDSLTASAAQIEDDHNKCVERLEGQVADLKADLELARTYKGVEGPGCPLCTFDNGTFIRYCSMHQRIEDLELQVEAYRKALDEIRAVSNCPVAWGIIDGLSRQSNDRVGNPWAPNKDHLGKPVQDSNAPRFCEEPVRDITDEYEDCGRKLPCPVHTKKSDE